MIVSRSQLSSLLVAGGMVVSVHFLASSLETLIFGNVIQTAGAGGDDGASSVMLAVGPDSRACAVAKRRALTIAPELLSLAPWPLDDHAPAECSAVPQDSLAVADEALPAEVEMADASSAAVVLADAVLAELAGSEKPLAKKSPGLTPRTLDAANVLGQQLAAVDTASLDDVRGGFELEGSSLKFTIGIERAVYINGNLVATNVLNLKDLQSSAGGTSVAGALPAAAPSGALVVQNGPAGTNYVAPQVAQNPTATVIQNSLNDQKIQAVTTINASVNSLQTVRAMSVANAIQYGIVSSLRR